MNSGEAYFSVFKLSFEEKLRLGLVKLPRPKRTMKVVYPVHVGSSAMYYKTEMIAPSELITWIRKYPQLEVME